MPAAERSWTNWKGTRAGRQRSGGLRLHHVRQRASVASPPRDPGQGQGISGGRRAGRADLITLRGAELLKIADCIIMDKLANPALLELARKDAEIIHVPKRIGPGSFTQDQINQILVAQGPGRQDRRAAQRRRSVHLRPLHRGGQVAE